jgi:DNA (cytosine-5)-methyltransferase 1
MIYGSVCSGIEAASVAWHPLGWRPAWFAEISAFPSAVLQHRWPGVKNHGDFTTIRDSEPIDLLVGGTPCQSFSVAGLRGGLEDDRGNLALEFVRLAERLRPRWVVWENVPGVLSSNGGRDFGSILGALAFLGYGFAYRVLDAQFFGVPQRRRRVFLVGYLGDWRRAHTVLFERPISGLDSGTREELPASYAKGSPFIFKASYFTRGKDGAPSTVSPPLSADADKGDQDPIVFDGVHVRRLTPLECERLQGFPDEYTSIPNATDTSRCRSLGNTMAVPCMAWLGRRIAAVDCLP